MLDPIRAEWLAPAPLFARARLRPDDVVADLGAGPGYLTLPLARAVPRGRVIATDIRRDYLDALAARAAAAGLGNVETRLVPPDRAALAPRSIDLAVLCQLDHYLADRAGYLARLVPALRAGGRLLVVNYARYREADLAAAAQAGLRVVDAWRPSPPFFALLLEPLR